MTAVRTGTDFIGKDGTGDKCHDSNIRIDPDVNMTEYHRLARCQTGLRPNGLGPGTKATAGLPMLLEGAGCAPRKRPSVIVTGAQSGHTGMDEPSPPCSDYTDQCVTALSTTRAAINATVTVQRRPRSTNC